MKNDENAPFSGVIGLTSLVWKLKKKFFYNFWK